MQKICGIVLIIILIAADRITKVLAVSHLKGRGSVELIPGVFELRYLQNSGAAFGILQGKMWLFYILTGVITLVCFLIYLRLPGTLLYLPLRISLILLISGALGNFIDRITQQYVVDFLYFKLIDFPIFNVADIYVTTAAFLLIILILFVYSEEQLTQILHPGR